MHEPIAIPARAFHDPPNAPPPCRSGPAPSTPEPLAGGITNLNFTVADAGRRYLVRIGGDIPEHKILRRFELRRRAAPPTPPASRPPSATPRRARSSSTSSKGAPSPRRTSATRRTSTASPPSSAAATREMPRHYRGPAPIFWVFQVLRDYAHTLREAAAAAPTSPALLAAAEPLEAAVGPVEIVFGHNDLLPANLIDDGDRLWLVDWEYAGFNSPLFDLGGLASNAGMTAAERDGPAHRLLRPHARRRTSSARRRR